MKKLLLILLLSAPVFALAQENLIGKTKAEVAVYFKKAKIPLHSSDNHGNSTSDEYKTGDHPDITCFFDKAKICRKELVILAFSDMAKIQADLNRDWVKIDKGVWANKKKTVKVHLTGIEAMGQLYMIYAAFDKDFGSSM